MNVKLVHEIKITKTEVATCVNSGEWMYDIEKSQNNFLLEEYNDYCTNKDGKFLIGDIESKEEFFEDNGCKMVKFILSAHVYAVVDMK